MDRTKILQRVHFEAWVDPLGLTQVEYEVARELAERMHALVGDSMYDELVSIVTGTDK